MNYYEHTFIARQDLPESQNKRLIEKYENIINKNSGKVIKSEDWGLRSLSYSIFEGEGKTVDELEKAENIDEKLIRYLSVKVKKHDLEKNYFEKKDTQRILGKDEKK